MKANLNSKVQMIGVKDKIKISSKRLQSGKFQVEFKIETEDHYSRHGYMLTEPSASLKEVIRKIMDRIAQVKTKEMLYHGHLYNIRREVQQKDLIIF